MRKVLQKIENQISAWPNITVHPHRSEEENSALDM